MRDFLRLIGAWEVKYLGGLGSRRGVPDLLACYRGRFFALELKAPRGRLSAEQAEELRRVREAGGIACEVRSLEDVIEALRQVDPEIVERVRV